MELNQRTSFDYQLFKKMAGTPFSAPKPKTVKCTYRQKQKARMKAAGFTSKKAYKKWLKKQKVQLLKQEQS